MSKKSNFKKIKIISFKDIISILLIFIILLSLTTAFATNSPIIYVSPVTARNLAMFASLAYVDLENISKNNMPDTNVKNLKFKEISMVTDDQLSKMYINTDLDLVGNVDIPLSDKTEDAYSYLFYNLASTDEVRDWKIVNYIKSKVTNLKIPADFTAMTFKKGNNIVIAYRGTDTHDLGEWAQDILYGLISYCGQEEIAIEYAKSIAKQFKNHNIYVTGHSLGGYLAQIGGSAIVNEYNVKEVGYFNGIGLKFWSNILGKISSIPQKITPKLTKKINNLKVTKGISNLINDLINENSNLNKIQNEAKKALTKYKNKGGKIVSYHINGDIVASLGTHVGEKIGYNAHPLCITNHNGNKSSFVSSIKNATLSLITININPFLNNPITKYALQYKPASFMDYFWITHETDSFFGVLPYEDGSLPSNIKTEIKTPNTIKINKTSEATLTITTIGAPLKTYDLKTNNFKISNSSSLKISSVSLVEMNSIKYRNTYTYTYAIKLKGGKWIGFSTIALKANVLKLDINNVDISNNISTSKIITTKLF